MPPRIPIDPRRLMPQAKPKAEPQPQPAQSRRFVLRIGVTVFGTPSYFSVDDAILDFQTFVQQSSKLDLQIAINKYPPLALDEFHLISGAGGSTFVDPWYVHPETLAKLPYNAAVQIVLFDILSTKPAWGGAAFQASPQTRNAPFVGIAFGDSISWWPVEPNWRSRTATALVHEFYHAISQLLHARGFTLPDADKANSYGYTNENDPGWVRFDKFIYGQITDQMYSALTK